VGRGVLLLEADRITAGVTGYTTAKLTALHTMVYAKLAKDAGADAARLYAQSQQQAVERVATLASQLGIDCDLERVPAFTYAESADRSTSSAPRPTPRARPAWTRRSSPTPACRSRSRAPCGSRTRASSTRASTCSAWRTTSSAAADASPSAPAPSVSTRATRAG
jgi:glycine/D-amino acid oxidase-like deaminating enzyme